MATSPRPATTSVTPQKRDLARTSQRRRTYSIRSCGRASHTGRYTRRTSSSLPYHHDSMAAGRRGSRLKICARAPRPMARHSSCQSSDIEATYAKARMRRCILVASASMLADLRTYWPHPSLRKWRSSPRALASLSQRSLRSLPGPSEFSQRFRRQASSKPSRTKASKTEASLNSDSSTQSSI